MTKRRIQFLLSAVLMLALIQIGGLFKKNRHPSQSIPSQTPEFSPVQSLESHSPADEDWPKEEIAPVYIHDSLANGTSLISKNFHDAAELEPSASKTDLWLRSYNGKERKIAETVTWAKFSPDGKKFAFATVREEILIQTLAGKLLGRIPNASDAHWQSDSRALEFLAVPSSEYPELRQMMIYEIASARIRPPEHVQETNSSNAGN